MNHRPNHKTTTGRSSTQGLKASRLPLAMMLALTAGTAIAQSTDTGAPATPKPEDTVIELDAFVVSGIKESYAKAIDFKREKIESVDVVVAEDIGKFPDNNVAESLQRVPGIQVTNRGSGEVATVMVRGLPDVSTTLNGQNIFTASGTALALADVPASLLNRIEVFKTRSADLIETGIAGQLNIRTHRPFDFKGDKGVIAARGIYQEQNDKVGPNLSALYSKRWENGAGKWGALVNVSFNQTPYRDQSVTAGAMIPFATEAGGGPFGPLERIFLTHPLVSENPIWQAGQLDGLPSTAGSTLSVNGVQTPYYLSRDAIFASDFTGERERSALNIALQWAPSDRAEYTLEAFYNGYRNESFNSLLFSFADWWGALGANPGANIEVYPGTNIIKSRKNIGFPYGFMSGDLTVGRTDSYLTSLSAKWKITDDFELRGNATYQNSKFTSDFFAMRTDRVHYMLDVDFNQGDGLTAFQFHDDPNTSADESNLADPSLWNTAQLYDNGNRLRGDAITVTLDAEQKLEFGPLNKLKFGFRNDARMAADAQRTQDGYRSSNLGSYDEGLWYVNKDFFDGNSQVPRSWVVANGHYIYSHADEIRALYGMPKEKVVENFNIEEVNTAAYAMAEFKTYLGGRKLDGHFGARWVHVGTDMNFVDLNTLSASSDEASISKLLPSGTIRFGITDDLRLRASYGETLRRPGFADLNPNIIYVEDVTNIGYGTASGGNPNLKPTHSKNYDLSLEYYFGKASMVYATGFMRKIDGFIVGFRKRVTFEGYDYILNQPDNASNGELKGGEFGLTYFPDYLPGPFKGLGLQASYTVLSSKQDTPITNDAGAVVGTKVTDLFGVSDRSYSIVLAYERAKFGARLSYVWRSAFLNNYEAAMFANPLEVWRHPEQSLDFQMNYQVTKNLMLTFDVTNITQEIYQSYYKNPTTNNFGSSLISRAFAVGARFSF